LLEVDASIQTGELAVKLLVGESFTVTLVVKTGEGQFAGEGVVICRVKVLVPAVDQLTVKGPFVVPGAGLQPSQFQLKVEPETAEPECCKVAFVLVQTGEDDEKDAVGKASTVTITVEVLEQFPTVPGLVIVRVIVLTPPVVQLKL
jgi:hypothetical protein